jgi:hypothetical protein
LLLFSRSKSTGEFAQKSLRAGQHRNPEADIAEATNFLREYFPSMVPPGDESPLSRRTS